MFNNTKGHPQRVGASTPVVIVLVVGITSHSSLQEELSTKQIRKKGSAIVEVRSLFAASPSMLQHRRVYSHASRILHTRRDL